MNKLRKCHYCGGEPVQSTFKDINLMGEQGYKSVIRCSLCHNQVEMWAKSYDDAVNKSIFYWNGEKENG